MTLYLLLAAYLVMAGYYILRHLEKLVVRRINDFYIILYRFPRPVVCLKMSRPLRWQKLSQQEVQRRLARCTSLLCKQLPPGTYTAYTHGRVLEGLRHMEQRGRAAILHCRPKGKPKKQKQVYRHLFGRRFDVQGLPDLQMYRVKFVIHKKEEIISQKRMPMGACSIRRLREASDPGKSLMIADPKGELLACKEGSHKSA